MFFLHWVVYTTLMRRSGVEVPIIRIHGMRTFFEDEREPVTVGPLPWALGFVLFAVLALLLGGAGLLVLAALGITPNWWLCALAVFILEVLLFYVAFGVRGGNLPGQVSRK